MHSRSHFEDNIWTPGSYYYRFSQLFCFMIFVPHITFLAHRTSFEYSFKSIEGLPIVGTDLVPEYAKPKFQHEVPGQDCTSQISWSVEETPHENIGVADFGKSLALTIQTIIGFRAGYPLCIARNTRPCECLVLILFVCFCTLHSRVNLLPIQSYQLKGAPSKNFTN